MEVLQWDSKEKRDEVYRQYRTEGDDLERQAVKFSDCRPLLSPDVAGEILLDEKGRARYISTYLIAYPSNRSVRRKRRN